MHNGRNCRPCASLTFRLCAGMLALILVPSLGLADIIIVTQAPYPAPTSTWIIPVVTPVPTRVPVPTQPPVVTPEPYNPYGYRWLPIISADVSRYHNQNGDNVYSAAKLIDQNLKSAWLYNCSEYPLADREDCYADLWLSYPGTVCELHVSNGYWGERKRYLNYSRAENVKVICYDNYGNLIHTMKYTLSDAGEGVEQIIPLGAQYNVSRVRYVILSRYKGSDTTSHNLQYRFIATTELSLWGY